MRNEYGRKLAIDIIEYQKKKQKEKKETINTLLNHSSRSASASGLSPPQGGHHGK